MSRSVLKGLCPDHPQQQFILEPFHIQGNEQAHKDEIKLVKEISETIVKIRVALNLMGQLFIYLNVVVRMGQFKNQV